TGRHPRHRPHRPQLDTTVRRHRRPRHRGRWADDPRCGHRPRIRPARRRRRGRRHPTDYRRATHPRPRNRRLRRDPVLTYADLRTAGTAPKPTPDEVPADTMGPMTAGSAVATPRKPRTVWVMFVVATVVGAVLISPYLLLDINDSRLDVGGEAH